jgi:hypothetical protein
MYAIVVQPITLPHRRLNIGDTVTQEDFAESHLKMHDYLAKGMIEPVKPEPPAEPIEAAQEQGQPTEPAAEPMPEKAADGQAEDAAGP